MTNDCGHSRIETDECSERFFSLSCTEKRWSVFVDEMKCKKFRLVPTCGASHSLNLIWNHLHKINSRRKCIIFFKSMNKLLLRVKFNTRLFKRYDLPYLYRKILYKLIHIVIFFPLIPKEVKCDFN